jgi:hypothetical protein
MVDSNPFGETKMKLIQMLRRLPLWAATCIAMLALVLVLVLARGLFAPATPRAPKPTVAFAETAPDASTPAPTESAPPASALTPAENAPPPPSMPAIVASVASADLRAPVSALQPPEGVQEGHVVQVAQARDQYNQWVTMSTSVVPVPDASFYVPAALQGHGQRINWHAWFRLEMPTMVAVLHVKADTGLVSAEIDGQPIGEIEHSGNRPPDRRVSSIELSPGWHQLRVTQQGAAIAQIAVTDGRTAPTIVVPWAVTAEGVTDAQARDGAAISAPAPASTAPAPPPVSAASAMPRAAAETTP